MRTSCLLLTAAASWTLAVARGLVVDLGYETYKGYYNSTYDLNIWKGIRYAAPPVGKLRWQAPQHPPASNHSGKITAAVEQPPICPQSGAYGTPEVYGFNSGPGDEDCLFLNVYAAPNASNVPVFVWIHGGGYSVFGATYDPSVLMNTNKNGFITVEIQYRLGAFGYLASPEVKTNGKLNAGLLDQRFALEWVQKHIARFGGDPKKVTIGGESSGAGSVMYQGLAYGGKSTDLFDNIIAASPYTPPIHHYRDSLPVDNYDKFAELSGCAKNSTAYKTHGSRFNCLVAANTTTLQRASGLVSTTRGYFGSFAWVPVVDDDFLRDRPSAQLLFGKITGKRLLVGNNANEGVPLTNPEVDTRAQYQSFIGTTLPHLTEAHKKKLAQIYHIDSAQEGNNGTRFDTLGNSGPTALNQSGMATGIQQAVFNMAAESTYCCPAQWLSEAYSSTFRKAWRYQYSLTPSYHGADLSAYFSVGATVPDADFRFAFQKMWGSFIIHNSPVISVKDATAGKANAVVPMRGGVNGAISWPEDSMTRPSLLNLNTTGGDVSLVTVTDDLSYYVRSGDGIVNHLRLVNPWSWEGGRGARCEFWRSIGQWVPQ